MIRACGQPHALFLTYQQNEIRYIDEYIESFLKIQQDIVEKVYLYEKLKEFEINEFEIYSKKNRSPLSDRGSGMQQSDRMHRQYKNRSNYRTFGESAV